MISVYDIEVFPNLFVISFINITTQEIKTFIISEWQNDFNIFVEYFLGHKGLIGFNNVDYDYRVLHPFICNPGDYRSMEGVVLTEFIYQRSLQVIDENFKEQRPIPLIPQRDLFRLWHFNNKARMVSLKYLQINMRWRNVQDSPFDFEKRILQKDIGDVIDYNINDIKSTLAFYHLSKDKIKLRTTLSDRYGVNMGNFSDNKIGETIFMHELATRTKKTLKAISAGRTPRHTIPVRDCLVDTIKFETKEFNAVLEYYKKLTITNTKKRDNKSVVCALLDGTRYEFGMGGLHALRGSGVYKDIASADVSSYYPNLAISYKIYPQHLGIIFCEVYKKIYDEKKTFKKKSDEDTAFKAALVCVFGSSNAPWSPFYDPKYTMSITINGQLLLAMLCEQLVIEGAGHIIMANTDGLEVEVIDDNKFKEICKRWQETHTLLLEFTKYNQIAIRDVNAYHAINTNGEVKTKGDFVIDKEIYKDQSMKIVPIAVDAYFRFGTPPEKTINQNSDISNFLIGKRARTGKLEFRTTEIGLLKREKLSKNVRYYISRSGGSIVKVTKNTDKQNKHKKNDISPNQTSLFDVKESKDAVTKSERITALHAGYRMKLFNQWIDEDKFENYGVDKQFYIREANKLINSVVQNNLTL